MPDKPTNNRSKLAWGLAILVGLIAYGIYLFFCFSVLPQINDSLNDSFSETYRIYQPLLTDLSADDISMLEGNADFKFPPDAHEIYGYVTGFHEMFAQVRFSMKANELPAFIKTTLCDKPLENFVPTTEQKEQNDPRRWWKVYQAKKLQRCFGQSEYANQGVYVDMTVSQTYIVYISNSTRESTRIPPTQPKTETNP